MLLQWVRCLSRAAGTAIQYLPALPCATSITTPVLFTQLGSQQHQHYAHNATKTAAPPAPTASHTRGHRALHPYSETLVGAAVATSALAPLPPHDWRRWHHHSNRNQHRGFSADGDPVPSATDPNFRSASFGTSHNDKDDLPGSPEGKAMNGKPIPAYLGASYSAITPSPRLHTMPMAMRAFPTVHTTVMPSSLSSSPVVFSQRSLSSGAEVLKEPRDIPLTNNKDLGSPTAYASLTMLHSSQGAYFFMYPEAAVHLLFAGKYGAMSAAGGLATLHNPLMQILGIGFAAAAVANAVQYARLPYADIAPDPALHRRIDGGLVLFGVGNILLTGMVFTPLAGSYLGGVYGSELLNPATAGFLGAVLAMQVYVSSNSYAKNMVGGDIGSRLAPLKAFSSDITHTFSGASNILSKSYAALSIIFIAAGFSYLFAPYMTLDGAFGMLSAPPEDVVLWQKIGLGLATLLGPMALSLKDAAAAGTLSDSRYKALNVGILTASLGHLFVFGSLMGTPEIGPLLPLLLGAWGGAGVVSTLGLFAKKK